MTEPPKNIKRISHRRLPDGSYNNKPSDPGYFNNYYHTKGTEMTTCYRCGVACRKNYLSTHIKTKKCFKEIDKKLAALKETFPELDF